MILKPVKCLAVSGVTSSDTRVCVSSFHRIWKGCVPPGNTTHVGSSAFGGTVYPCGLLRFRTKLSSEALNPFRHLIGPVDVEGVCLFKNN
jgi:hypothetical protein